MPTRAALLAFALPLLPQAPAPKPAAKPTPSPAPKPSVPQEVPEVPTGIPCDDPSNGFRAGLPVGKPCSGPEHRQFDFWIGEWEVRDPAGKVVGHNRIEPIACGLQEHWSDMAGGTGTSLNAYNAAAKKWHQTWVGGGGAVIQIDGGLVNGRMVLQGVDATPKGPVTDRITWSPEGRDAQGRAKVRQLWEQSRDGGKTWTVVFDGMYIRTGKS